MEAFNPYRAWLGVTSNSEPPNHYELLGLRMLRAEPAEVAEAFQRQVSRLSAYLPGEHASIAQRILSELATAKVELLTPTTKRIYDATLAAGKQPAPRLAAFVGNSPKPSEWVASDDWGASDDWLPPAADPTLASSFAPGASSAIPVMPEQASELQAVAPMNQPLPPPNQPLPPAHQPLPQAPMTPAAAPAAAMPIYGYQQPYGQAVPTAAAPYYGGHGPSAMPIASAPYGTPMAAVPMTAPAPILYAQAAQAYNSGQVYGSGQEYHTGMSAVAVANQEPFGPAHAASAPASSVAARGRFQRQSSPVPIVAGVLLAGVLIVVVGIYVKSASGPVAAKPSTHENSQVGSKKVGGKSPGSATKPRRQREPMGQTEPDDQPSKPRLSDQPWPPKGDPDKVEQSDPASKTESDMSDSAVSDPKMSDAAKPEPNDPEPAKPDPANPNPDTTSPANPKTAKPDTTKPDPANPEVPVAPEPGEPTPEATPKQEAAVKRALTAARTALGKRDLETVKEQLDLATLDAVTPELDAEVARVQRLEEYVELFWKAVSETLPKLEVGEEFTVNGVVGGVVEGRADMLVIRVQGRNREYPLYDIPTTLAVMLAERWLDKTDKHTPVVIGAFLLADPKGDDQEARRLFEQGADRGVDVAPLLKELENRES